MSDTLLEAVQVALDAAREDDCPIVEHDRGVCVVWSGAWRLVTTRLLEAAGFERIRAGVFRWTSAPKAPAPTPAASRLPKTLHAMLGTAAERRAIGPVPEGTIWQDTATGVMYIATAARVLSCGCGPWRRVDGFED